MNFTVSAGTPRHHIDGLQCAIEKQTGEAIAFCENDVSAAKKQISFVALESGEFTLSLARGEVKIARTIRVSLI